MTKEELEKEAKTECFMLTVNTIGIDQRDVELAYVMGAEPREKRIAELEHQLTHRNCLDCSNHSSKLRMRTLELEKENAELEAQIEKLIDFVLSKTECCDVCPITDTCINSEGTCLYAGILAKGEEEVTREWLMQKIAKEIKEK